jgi:hypothetical protein
VKSFDPISAHDAVAALVKAGREPRTMRWILRALLTQNLEARLPDDEALRGIRFAGIERDQGYPRSACPKAPD